MARAYSKIAFTPTVRALQARYGSAQAYEKFLAPETPPNDALGEAEISFIREREGFYQATVSETGWPYLQYRGGLKGFVHALDARTLAYADFRGNRQYLSVGNLANNDRIALFFMDYANRRRLKLFGNVRLVDLDDDPALIRSLHNPGYHAKPERAFLINVAGFDWNCPQHITERYTRDEIESAVAPLRDELQRLQMENEELKRKLGA
ncbi:pyridoxamine 5'-phosphate oxidase family protein [Hyphococcus sp.]|uniref:pyridoxamine 5'-phosphate oxidase family protein n=1 Tax=Hyphococcus sp. TaxID=2038636 RepID=UPI0035C6F57E